MPVVSITLTLRPRERGGLVVYPLEHATTWGVDAFVTSRAGGVSVAPYDTMNLAAHVGDNPEAVRENRRRVARVADVDPDHLIVVNQVHGNGVVRVEGPLRPVDADAMVSDADDLALAILVADCAPVLLVDVASTRFALAHAGWRGLVAGVLPAVVSCFDDVTSVRAIIGPTISRDAYQVGPEVAAHFADVAGALVPDEADRWRLDVAGVAAHQLGEAGIAYVHIARVSQTTDGGDPFFSDRAARPCGRSALVARRSMRAAMDEEPE